MASRLTKIYTRTGDAGTTGMADGTRVDKDDMLIQTIGEFDELNSQLAVLGVHVPASFVGSIKKIQNELFDVGAEISMGPAIITQDHIDWLEQSVDMILQSLTPLEEFILPGGGLAASHCHVARAVCRRAERSLVALNKVRPVNDDLLAYVNRLSDYLFVLARAISKEAGEEEVYWQSSRLKK
ncbi:MAG: cob(I)yrinic acid a,c-diamide adenosyltransferase [Gammaproteobacteria bacterium]